jgi:hypothetical protein
VFFFLHCLISINLKEVFVTTFSYKIHHVGARHDKFGRRALSGRPSLLKYTTWVSDMIKLEGRRFLDALLS